MKRLRVERTGAVGRITLARPEKKNALDRQMADELFDAVSRLGSDGDVSVILLAADGDDFCAGADLESLEAMVDAGAEVHREDAEALARVFTALRETDAPVAAAVRGRALAGGAGLATACDLVLAHERATFGYPEVRVGFVPAMVMTMLRRSVGEKRAFDLVCSGRLISAREALEIGLISRVFADHEFGESVQLAVAEIARAPRETVRRTKRLFYELDTLDFRSAMGLGVIANVEARRTEAFRAGIRRFLDRRLENS